MTDRPLHPSSRAIALACAAAVALAASWTLGLPALGARLRPADGVAQVMDGFVEGLRVRD